MSTYVALLRGINVGGNRRLPMAQLRELAERAGFTDVATYIQSGNVVLKSRLSAAKVASALHDAIEEATGFDVSIFVRSAKEWQAIVDGNPFPDVDDGTEVHVAFHAANVASDVLGEDLDKYAPERFVIAGREVYFSLPNGLGRAAIVTANPRNAVFTSGTMRNWNTVLTLADMIR